MVPQSTIRLTGHCEELTTSGHISLSLTYLDKKTLYPADKDSMHLGLEPRTSGYDSSLGVLHATNASKNSMHLGLEPRTSGYDSILTWRGLHDQR